MGFFLKNINKYFQPGTVFDIGVGYGTPELYDSYPKSKHVLIEALSEFENYLKEISNIYHAEYHITALGSEEGVTDITVYQDNLQASTTKNRKQLPLNSSKVYQKKVPITTLDDFKDYRSPYLVKIDVEGQEFDVLKGGKELLRNTEIVILEVNSPGKFSNPDSFHELFNYLFAQNFILLDLLDLHDYGFPLNYFNAAFIKKDGALYNRLF